MKQTTKHIIYGDILTRLESLIKLVEKYDDFAFLTSDAYNKRENKIFEYMNNIVEFTEEQNAYLSKCTTIERLNYYYYQLTTNLAFKVKFTDILTLKGYYNPTTLTPNKFTNIIHLGYCNMQGANLFSAQGKVHTNDTETEIVIFIFKGEFLTK